MLELAFRSSSLSVAIDTQEIERPGPSYTVETLRAIRRETSDTTSLIFIIGADQLKNLDSWHEWKQLFDYANIAVAARPGFSLDSKDLSPVLYETFHNRLAAPQEISTTPHGLTCFSGDTALPVSSGEIRKNLRHSGESRPPVPPEVLDYIVTHNLYRD